MIICLDLEMAILIEIERISDQEVEEEAQMVLLVELKMVALEVTESRFVTCLIFFTNRLIKC